MFFGHLGFEGFAGDGVAGAAAWATDPDGFATVEESFGVGTHGGGQEVKDFFLVAAAVPAEGAGFEEAEFFVLIELVDLIEG